MPSELLILNTVTQNAVRPPNLMPEAVLQGLIGSRLVVDTFHEETTESGAVQRWAITTLNDLAEAAGSKTRTHTPSEFASGFLKGVCRGMQVRLRNTSPQEIDILVGDGVKVLSTTDENNQHQTTTQTTRPLFNIC